MATMNHLALLLGTYMAFTGQNSWLTNTTIREWSSFKLDYGKQYDSNHVEEMRKTIFANSKRRVVQFTENEESESFSIKLNYMADMSDLEVMQMRGFKVPQHNLGAAEDLTKNTPEAEAFLDRILSDQSIEVPDELDWRKVDGRVSEVKNQGACGSCWAFASTGCLEGQEKVRSKLLRGLRSANSSIVELSEQNLVDCSKENYGCNGGFMKIAFDFVKSEKGIDDEGSYPYEAATRKCRFKKDKVAFSDSGAAILPSGDEQKLKEVVAKFGPVSVAIDASSFWFSLYHKGVYYNKHCKSKLEQLDHAVLVVGYGTDPKKGDYWIVKNSWSPHWGEQGYIRMARNRKNNCGIATVATIPIF